MTLILYKNKKIKKIQLDTWMPFIFRPTNMNALLSISAVVWMAFVWKWSNSRSPAVGGTHQPQPIDEGGPAEVVVFVLERGLIRYGVILHFRASNNSLPFHGSDNFISLEQRVAKPINICKKSLHLY